MDIIRYREGRVVLQKVANLGCCHLSEVEKDIFQYIEMMDSDGTRHFAYEDEEGYEDFQNNFHSKRFTSFHEFFTTEELKEEDRGGLKFKYYVRRDASCYEKRPLESLREELKNVERVKDRITMYGHYDRKVDYHGLSADVL